MFIIRSISNVVTGLERVTKVNVAQIPGDESLAVVGEMLLVIVLSDVVFDLVVHMTPLPGKLKLAK